MIKAQGNKKGGGKKKKKTMEWWKRCKDSTKNLQTRKNKEKEEWEVRERTGWQRGSVEAQDLAHSSGRLPEPSGKCGVLWMICGAAGSRRGDGAGARDARNAGCKA